MILAATGHRPDKLLGRYSKETFNRLVRFAVREIASLETYNVITGMALGWDLAVAQACKNLCKPYSAFLPCDNQASRWPLESQKLWQSLVDSAQEVINVSPGPYAAWKMQARNIAMVDKCDTLLALWNGTNGGTANCVHYAESQKRSIINCWERWEKFK